MTPFKNAAHFVSDYLPQIFMILILIAAFSMARLPVEDTAKSQPAKAQLQVQKIALH